MSKETSLNFFYYLFGFKKINSGKQWTLVVVTHVIAWLIFFTLPLFFFRVEISDNRFLYRELANKFFLIGFFYFNYFFLIPKFFIRKKYFMYLILVVASVSVLFAEHFFAEKIMTNGFKEPPNHFLFRQDSLRTSDHQFFFTNKDLPKPKSGPVLVKGGRTIAFFPRGVLWMILSNVVSSTSLMLLLGGFIHLAYSFIKSQDEKRSLENAGLKAEIGQLKSQINPHFLFNTLNSIYSQAYHKSGKVDESILKLSDILRYVLYETSSDTILLEKDVHYLSNYIDLQRLRLPAKVRIDYEVTGNLDGLFIAPLLLITFIENAFKHGISYTQASKIFVHIDVVDKTLTMLVRNPKVAKDTFDNRGIGLKNARRRLELIYPDDYFLDIVDDDNFYVVNLKINLNRHELHDY